jgi:predicted nucleic acid-binding protein
MIVVDANVIVYAVVESERTALAKKIAAKDSRWILPPLWRFEVTSSLVTLIRGKALDSNRAATALREADELSSNREVAVQQQAVLDTALLFNLSAYDAQYIALARRFKIKCVTADQRILKNAPQFAISIEDAINNS